MSSSKFHSRPLAPHLKHTVLHCIENESLCHIFVLINNVCFGTVIFVLTVSLYILRAYRKNTLKHSSVYEALLPFFSPVLLFVLSTLWISLSPSDILKQQPRIFYLMVGTAFSNITVSAHSPLAVWWQKWHDVNAKYSYPYSEFVLKFTLGLWW